MFGLTQPSLTPRFLAAANAALVRSEMSLASCCATLDSMLMVNSFASGQSRATNFSPLSCKALTKETDLASLSNFEMSSFAP